MARQSILDAAQKKVVKAAKVGAEGVKDVATDALGRSGICCGGRRPRASFGRARQWPEESGRGSTVDE
jgi:hypothetical protein